MRILQVVTDTDRRGAQVFATDLERGLAARGHEVRTVALARGEVGGLPVEALGPRRWSVATVRALRCEMGRVDVTIAHGSTTGPACALAAVGPGRPFVYRQISDSRFWAPTRAKRLRVRATLAPAARVVALSEVNRADLVDWIGLRPDRIAVVPNGVPGDRFVPATPAARTAARRALAVPDDATVVCCVNALVPEKGTDDVVRAVGALPAAILVVAGDGPQRAALESLAREVAPDRIGFVGSREDATELYAAADLVVLASRGGDAMPATLIEAGLCGIPVIGTRIGAIPEVVRDGETGFVTPPADADALRRAIEALVTDPGRRDRMGCAARAHCLERFEIGPVAAGWEAVLDAVVAPG